MEVLSALQFLQPLVDIPRLPLPYFWGVDIPGGHWQFSLKLPIILQELKGPRMAGVITFRTTKNLFQSRIQYFKY